MITENRLAKSEAPTKRTSEEWCQIGNAHLASIGRSDVHWFVQNGRATIGYRR